LKLLGTSVQGVRLPETLDERRILIYGRLMKRVKAFRPLVTREQANHALLFAESRFTVVHHAFRVVVSRDLRMSSQSLRHGIVAPATLPFLAVNARRGPLHPFSARRPGESFDELSKRLRAHGDVLREVNSTSDAPLPYAHRL